MRTAQLAPVVVLLATMACVTQSSVQAERPFVADHHARVSVEPCRSRMAEPDPGLEASATKALRDKLARSEVFELVPAGDVIATCDLELFAEGNAFERWLVPGWNPTLAQVAVTLWEQPGDHELVSVRGKAAVRSGGLYTVGADHYILPTAMDEVVEQLVEWARGVKKP